MFALLMEPYAMIQKSIILL